MIGRRFAAISIVACALVTCSGGHSHPVKNLQHANVLLITLDTTRADHLGAYGYAAAQTPVLDGLARDGVLFEHCITPTAYTLPSHSSIMTGLYPPSHGVRINGDVALADSNVTLAERLAAKGYRTGAFVGAFVLDGRWGLSQGFQHYDDAFHLGQDQRLDLARVQRPANQVVDAALKWLDARSSQPFFAWVHLYDAHAPYEPPEPFRSRASSPYDGEIAFADSQAGRLLGWLDKTGQKDNTVVIIVGDHGEGLGDHGESEHGYYIYDYAVRVPLIARIPGASTERVSAQVRTIDIAPTILDLVAAETPKDVQGASLLPLISGQPDKPRYAYSESMATKLQYGWAALYSLRTNDYKFIEAPRGELYDLEKDPSENANRLDDERRVALQLREALKVVRDDSAKRAPKSQEANIDQETMRKLASLGYLGGGSSSTASSGDDKNLADPKDKMHLFDSIGHAAYLIGQNDYKKAAMELEIVLKDDPKIPQAQLLLVSAYRKTGRTDQAKTILDRYLKEDPSNVRALVTMAEILEEQGRDDDVMAICRRALAVDSRNAHAYEVMADVYMARNDHNDALPLLRKVVEIQPKLTRSRNNLAAALIGVGQLGEAEPILEDITRQYPKFPLAHYHLGLLRERQGRFQEARAAYQTEVTNHPKSIVARFNLGNVLLHLGDEAGAEEQMRILIKDDPQSARPYLLLARVLLGRPGRLQEVESLARAGLERAKEPDLKALGYFLLADVYSREGRRSELEDAVRKGEHYRSLIGS
ncbi:MAG TPA: sulfatase-like hydrolase/transferase [Thermoanaerobaculia bacterium]